MKASFWTKRPNCQTEWNGAFQRCFSVCELDRHRGIGSGFVFEGAFGSAQTASTDDVEVQTSPGAPGLPALGLAVEAVELALWRRLPPGYVGLYVKLPRLGGRSSNPCELANTCSCASSLQQTPHSSPLVPGHFLRLAPAHVLLHAEDFRLVLSPAFTHGLFLAVP